MHSYFAWKRISVLKIHSIFHCYELCWDCLSVVQYCVLNVVNFTAFLRLAQKFDARKRYNKSGGCLSLSNKQTAINLNFKSSISFHCLRSLSLSLSLSRSFTCCTAYAVRNNQFIIKLCDDRVKHSHNSHKVQSERNLFNGKRISSLFFDANYGELQLCQSSHRAVSTSNFVILI